MGEQMIAKSCIAADKLSIKPERIKEGERKLGLGSRLPTVRWL